MMLKIEFQVKKLCKIILLHHSIKSRMHERYIMVVILRCVEIT